MKVTGYVFLLLAGSCLGAQSQLHEGRRTLQANSSVTEEPIPTAAPIDVPLPPVLSGNVTESPSTPNVTEAPTVVDPDDTTAEPTIDSTASEAPTIDQDGTTTEPPSPSPISMASMPPIAPIPVPTDAPIHDKDSVDPAKPTNGPPTTNNPSNGIGSGAIFAIVVVSLILLAIFYFCFCSPSSKGGKRSDGMQEMELATWDGTNDDNGLL